MLSRSTGTTLPSPVSCYMGISMVSYNLCCWEAAGIYLGYSDCSDMVGYISFTDLRKSQINSGNKGQIF